jgi:hypothetical protein
VSSLFGITDLSTFADDNFIIRWNPNLGALKEEMARALSVIIKWLKGSGLKVNQSKREMCIFKINLSQATQIMIDGKLVKTRDLIDILGVEFHSKSKLSNHDTKAIKKSYKSLHAIEIIKKYIPKTELNMIATSNVFRSYIITLRFGLYLP